MVSGCKREPDNARALRAWDKYSGLQIDSSQKLALQDQITFLAKNKILHLRAFFANTDEQMGLKDTCHKITIDEGRIYLPCQGGMIGVNGLQNRKFTYLHDGIHLDLDSFNYETPFPVYVLPQVQLGHLQKLAGTSEDKPCIFQLTSVIKKGRGKWGPSQMDGVHIGCRIIDKEGNVYSFGKQSQPGEGEKQVGTKGGTIGMMDWEETSDDEGKERITISLPMSIDKKDDILGSFKKEWFNLLNQNCVRFALEKLNEVEPTNLDILLYPHQMLFSMTPFYNQDAELERRTQPKGPPTLCGRMITVLTFIPKILFSAILHVVLICIGGWHRHTYDPDHKNWTNPNLTISYNIFNYENLAIYHSKYLINWMLKQKSLQRFELTPRKPAFLLKVESSQT